MPDRSALSELRDRFGDAVADFHYWKSGDAEPVISFDATRRLPVSGVFSLLTEDLTPTPEDEEIYNAVCKVASELQGTPEAVGHDCSGPKDHTYADVALCMCRLFRARKEYYERKAAQRS
jgi:hypothetical protein